MTLALLALAAAYLVGSVPFGYLIARARGVDIFNAGSGNIGATNVGRVLGRKLGGLVFALDFLKGAGPVFVAGLLPADAQDAFGLPELLRVGCAAMAFLGHMFPVFLRFRGGKGVATGSGAVFVLSPGPVALVMLSWLALVSATRLVSLGSIMAVIVFCGIRLVSVADPFGRDHVAITMFGLIGSALVIVRHRANVRRLLAGTENRLGEKPMWGTLARVMHVLAVGLWAGGAVMFNFVAASTINNSFKDVVATSPNDRTAGLDIAAGATEEQKKDLASALFGAAVGPIFPRFFALQGVCAVLALFTAFGWRRLGRVHRVRFIVLLIAAATVAAGWPISQKVSALRVERLADPALRADFTAWHLVSLALSAVTALLALTALGMAGSLPAKGAGHEPKQ